MHPYMNKLHGPSLVFALAIGSWVLSCSDQGGDSTATRGTAGAGGNDATDASAGGTGAGSPGGAAGWPSSCPKGSKRCGETCVDINDPAHGCGPTSCDPCNLPHAAKAACDQGSCVVSACVTPFDDCDHSPSNGCETNVQSNASHCGQCGHKCKTGTFCNDAACADTCGAKTNCGGSCVDTQTDENNCGGCGIKCPNKQNGTPICSDGKCSTKCMSGYSLCGNVCVNRAYDGQNCGQCGFSCLGGDCKGGHCQPYRFKPSVTEHFPNGIIVHNDVIYWLDKDDNMVRSMTTSGGLVKEIAAVCPGEAMSLTTDGAYLFWGCTGKVQKAPLDGCPGGSATCATDISMGAAYKDKMAFDVAVSGTTLFIADFSATSQGLCKLSTSGGDCQEVDTNCGLYNSVTISGGYLYWTKYDAQLIKRMPINGGKMETVATLSEQPWALRVRGNDMYYFTIPDAPGGNTFIKRIAIKSSSTHGTTVAQIEAQAGFLDLTKDALYWTTWHSDDWSGSVSGLWRQAL